MKLLESFSSVLLMAVLSSAPGPAAAEEPTSMTVRGPRNAIRTLAFDWAKQKPKTGTVVSSDKGAAVRIERKREDARSPKTFPLLVIEKPPVGQEYALFGEVRYEGVEGKAYLEMLSTIRDRKTGDVSGPFFSRTLGSGGPSGALTGRSNFRPFVLPFTTLGRDMEIMRIEIGVHLPGAGTVDVGPVTLNAGTDVPHRGWWGPKAGGAIGGVSGALLGVLFVVLGVLMSKGRARTLVTASLVALATLGVVILGAGVVAVLSSQPYVVCYPLFLIGGLSTLLSTIFLSRARRRYAEIELRQMHAMDAS